MQSHRAVMREAIDAGCNSLLILEDDALLCPQFAAEAERFLCAVPDDWDSIFLGFQSAWWLAPEGGQEEVINTLVSRVAPHRARIFASR